MPRKEALAAIALIALTLVAYAPAMGGGFIWDDDDHVTANANLRTAEGLWNIWFVPRTSPQYYPLVHTTFWIEHQLFGLRSSGYHVVNIVLHAGAALLLWRLLVMLHVPAAWLAAAVWAIHPVQAESVAWVTERKNVLSAVFYFAAACAFMTWTSRPSLRLCAITVLLFIAALLSKTVTASLPAALVLVLWWKHNRVTKQQWLALAPMFIIGIIFGAFTAYLERDHVRAVGPEWDFSGIDRILIAGRAVWFYLRTLVLPVNLSFIYEKWPIDPRQAWQWAFPIAAVIALVTLFIMRDRWGRGPVVGALIFVGTLVPALGFFNIYPMRYSFVADHFQYHASAAMLTLLVVGLQRVIGSAGHLLLVPLLLLTMWRSSILADSMSLWLDTVEKNPNSWMVHLNLAKTYAVRGEDEFAQRHFERQAELAPHLPEARFNMGVNFARRGLLEEALREYDRALDLDPGFAQAWYGRGRVYVQQEKLDDAAQQFIKAIELKPDYALAHSELAELSARKRLFDRAIEHYRMAIDADPTLTRPRVNLAALLAARGEIDEATRLFDQAVRLDPALEMYRQAVLTPRPGN